MVPACGCTGRQPSSRFSKGVRWWSSARTSTTAISASRLQPETICHDVAGAERAPAGKASRRRFGRGVPDGTSSNPELTLCIGDWKPAGRRHAGSTDADGAVAAHRARCAAHQADVARPHLLSEGEDRKGGVPFRFIKFRTMVVGTETHGAGILCLKNDPRVTAVGRLLRRSSLDELPELMNVLRGEMSVIGPRPGLDYQVKEYTPDQRRRLTVLPGITGWAQVNGRNAISGTNGSSAISSHVERVSPRIRSLRSQAHARGHRSQRYADR